MMDLTTQDIHRIGKHFVSLTWLDGSPARLEKNEGRPLAMIVSGFVVSVRDVWFWVSAGHVILGIHEAIKKGQRLAKFCFDDRGTAAIAHPPFEFDFVKASHFARDMGDGIDIGVVHIRPYYVEFLKKNGIEPLDESYWETAPEPTEVSASMLMGIPSQLTETQLLAKAQKVSHTICIIPVCLTQDVPDVLKKEVFRLCGYLDGNMSEFSKRWESLDGMSGCPLFVLTLDKSGKVQHWLAGVQVSEVKSSSTHFIACCLFAPMGKILSGFIELGVFPLTDLEAVQGL